MKCENNQQSQDIYKYKPIFQFCLRAKCKSHSKPTQTFVLQISAALNYHYEDRIHQDAMFVCQNDTPKNQSDSTSKQVHQVTVHYQHQIPMLNHKGLSIELYNIVTHKKFRTYFSKFSLLMLYQR